jgi:cellulose biosynthesis protein BcsQ
MSPKTIVIAASNGGVGKSTLCAALGEDDEA